MLQWRVPHSPLKNLSVVSPDLAGCVAGAAYRGRQRRCASGGRRAAEGEDSAGRRQYGVGLRHCGAPPPGLDESRKHLRVIRLRIDSTMTANIYPTCAGCGGRCMFQQTERRAVGDEAAQSTRRALGGHRRRGMARQSLAHSNHARIHPVQPWRVVMNEETCGKLCYDLGRRECDDTCHRARQRLGRNLLI